jgi:hypothetical protein
VIVADCVPSEGKVAALVVTVTTAGAVVVPPAGGGGVPNLLPSSPPPHAAMASMPAITNALEKNLRITCPLNNCPGDRRISPPDQ